MANNRFETPFFVGLLLIAAVLVGYLFWPYIGSIVLAVIMAIFFHPVYERIRDRMPDWPSTAAFLTVLFAIVIILIPLGFIGFQIFQEVEGLYGNITTGNIGIFAETLNDQINRFVPGFNIDINKYLEQILGALAGSIGSVFTKVANTTIKIALGLFAFYYLLKDAQSLKKSIIRFMPLSRDKTETIIDKLLAMGNSVVKGSLVIAVVQGFLVGLGFLLFGLANPVLWGSVAVISSLIPVLGVGVIAIPGIVSLFISGNTVAAVGFTLWTALIAGLADNFLRPILMERDVHIHPLLIFFSVLGGLTIFGATGLLLGPLVLSFFLALLEIYPVILKQRD